MNDNIFVAEQIMFKVNNYFEHICSNNFVMFKNIKKDISMVQAILMNVSEKDINNSSIYNYVSSCLSLCNKIVFSIISTDSFYNSFRRLMNMNLLNESIILLKELEHNV